MKYLQLYESFDVESEFQAYLQSKRGYTIQGYVLGRDGQSGAFEWENSEAHLHLYASPFYEGEPGYQVDLTEYTLGGILYFTEPLLKSSNMETMWIAYRERMTAIIAQIPVYVNCYRFLVKLYGIRPDLVPPDLIKLITTTYDRSRPLEEIIPELQRLQRQYPQIEEGSEMGFFIKENIDPDASQFELLRQLITLCGTTIGAHQYLTFKHPVRIEDRTLDGLTLLWKQRIMGWYQDETGDKMLSPNSEYDPSSVRQLLQAAVETTGIGADWLEGIEMGFFANEN